MLNSKTYRFYVVGLFLDDWIRDDWIENWIDTRSIREICIYIYTNINFLGFITQEMHENWYENWINVLEIGFNRSFLYEENLR